MFTHTILKSPLDAQFTTHDIYEADSCDFFPSALGDSRENAKKAAHSASKKQAHLFRSFLFSFFPNNHACRRWPKEETAHPSPATKKPSYLFLFFSLSSLSPFFSTYINITTASHVSRRRNWNFFFFCFLSLRKQHSHRPFASHCRCTATHCQLTATRYNELQRATTNCNQLQRTATHCEPSANSLQRVATHCNALQLTASLCTSLQLPTNSLQQANKNQLPGVNSYSWWSQKSEKVAAKKAQLAALRHRIRLETHHGT